MDRKRRSKASLKTPRHDRRLVYESLKKHVSIMGPSVDRVSENLSRANNLIKIYKHLFGKGRGKRHVHKADVLRAAVVFTHASLEDFLRSLAAAYLPHAGEEVLNFIPLHGLSASGRAEKFFLGKLVQHRGKTVDNLIEDSVRHHLERSNYGDTTEISTLLTGMGLNISNVNGNFSELDKMIRRRHQIVHRADRVDAKGRGKQFAQSLGPAEVTKWVTATKEFMADVLVEIARLEFEKKDINFGAFLNAVGPRPD